MKKPYEIIMKTDDTAEVNMYGEIITTRPVDWWTGEPVPGDFIVVDEFLEDLDNLKDKTKITVHINSGGGDLYAGLAIYNRLKELPAEIITINDGLAASAASVVFQAGDTRKVNASSTVMVHQAAGGLCGYYQVADLEKVINQLESCNKAAINVYAEAGGADKDALKALLDAESWLVGQEAVDAGLADEVIDEVGVVMKLSHDKKRLDVNGVQLSTGGMYRLPAGIPVQPAANLPTPVSAVAEKNTNEGSKIMDVKNIEELEAKYPKLVNEVKAKAFAEGQKQGAIDENKRLKGIESIQAAVVSKDLINEAKYGEEKMTAEQLAFKAMQAQAEVGMTVLADIKADAEESGVDAVTTAPVAGEQTEADKQTEKMNAAIANYKKMNGVK